MTLNANATGALRNAWSVLNCTTGTIPERTADTARYRNVQMTSDAMIPIGRSRRGFLASSAVVDTASKPMYAKKATAAAAIMPDQPYGANGDQFPGLT